MPPPLPVVTVSLGALSHDLLPALARPEGYVPEYDLEDEDDNGDIEANINQYTINTLFGLKNAVLARVGCGTDVSFPEAAALQEPTALQASGAANEKASTDLALGAKTRRTRGVQKQLAVALTRWSAWHAHLEKRGAAPQRGAAPPAAPAASSIGDVLLPQVPPPVGTLDIPTADTASSRDLPLASVTCGATGEVVTFVPPMSHALGALEGTLTQYSLCTIFRLRKPPLLRCAATQAPVPCDADGRYAVPLSGLELTVSGAPPTVPDDPTKAATKAGQLVAAKARQAKTLSEQAAEARTVYQTWVEHDRAHVEAGKQQQQQQPALSEAHRRADEAVAQAEREAADNVARREHARRQRELEEAEREGAARRLAEKERAAEQQKRQRAEELRRRQEEEERAERQAQAEVADRIAQQREAERVAQQQQREMEERAAQQRAEEEAQRRAALQQQREAEERAAQLRAEEEEQRRAALQQQREREEADRAAREAQRLAEEEQRRQEGEAQAAREAQLRAEEDAAAAALRSRQRQHAQLQGRATQHTHRHGAEHATRRAAAPATTSSSSSATTARRHPTGRAAPTAGRSQPAVASAAAPSSSSSSSTAARKRAPAAGSAGLPAVGATGVRGAKAPRTRVGATSASASASATAAAAAAQQQQQQHKPSAEEEDRRLALAIMEEERSRLASEDAALARSLAGGSPATLRGGRSGGGGGSHPDTRLDGQDGVTGPVSLMQHGGALPDIASDVALAQELARGDRDAAQRTDREIAQLMAGSSREHRHRHPGGGDGGGRAAAHPPRRRSSIQRRQPVDEDEELARVLAASQSDY